MKKWMIWLLAATMLLGAAAAEGDGETRIRTIVIEGMEEEITERLYASKFGYVVGVDEEFFALAACDEGCDMHFVSVGTSEGETPVASVCIRYGEDVAASQRDGFIHQDYALGDLSIHAEYLPEAAEGYGARIGHMVSGIEIPARYESNAGFVLHYMANLLRPAEGSGTDYDEFVPVADDEALLQLVLADVPWELAEDFLGEAVFGFDEAGLTETEHAAEENVEFHTRAAVEGGTVYRFYTVKAPEGVLCVTAMYPEEDLSGYGKAMDDAVRSIRFTEE